MAVVLYKLQHTVDINSFMANTLKYDTAIYWFKWFDTYFF